MNNIIINLFDLIESLSSLYDYLGYFTIFHDLNAAIRCTIGRRYFFVCLYQLSLYLSYLSVCFFVYQFIYQLIYLSICLSLINKSIFLSICI